MITTQEYKQRRASLAQSLMTNSIAIIPGASEVLRNGDAHYRFRQDSDFYYLTGFNEPGALLVITSNDESILFNLPLDPSKEVWTGYRLGQMDAPSFLGIDKAYSIEEASSRLLELMKGQSMLYYPLNRAPHWQKLIFQTWETLKSSIRQGIEAPSTFADLSPLISEQRLFKSESEIALMKQATEISCRAHEAVMRRTTSSVNECELEAVFLYEMHRLGCNAPAYTPIVASGRNSCILHYVDNNKPLAKQDLLLVDAGGEFHNYAADITRTYPISGRFTAEQKALYEVVLRTQRAGIETVTPGTPWNHVQDTMIRMLTDGLIELGILSGNLEDLVASQAYKPFYMHGSGHWLGLDVHDCGAYKKAGTWRAFEPGMALTVEPGLYISDRHPSVPERWHNLGIRIEDDLLVTASGNENLSASLAVNVADIEAIIGE